MSSTTWVGGDSGNETDWATGANWSTGSIPTTSAHVVIANTGHNCVLDTTRTIGSLTIQSGATIVGGGLKLIIQSEGDASGGTEHYALKNDGIVSGNLDIDFTYAGETAADFNGSSGTFQHVRVNAASADVNQDGPATLASLVVVANSTFDTGNNTLTVEEGNISVSGTLLLNNGTVVISDTDSALSISNTGTVTCSNTNLTVNAVSLGQGTFTAPSASGSFIITGEKDGLAFDYDGNGYVHNSGTIQIKTAASTFVDFTPNDAAHVDINNVTIDHASCVAKWTHACTIAGDLLIKQGTMEADDGDEAFTVQGNVTVGDGSGSANTAVLGNAADTAAMTFGSLTIASDGKYIATSGTTKLTNNTASGTRSFYNNGGTFTHNNGTIHIDTSANTNYDFDGDDLYNFTVECEDGSGALTCDGEASTAVTVLNNLDIKMGVLRTNANTFTIHGNVFVRETSLTDKNKFVAQGANQTVKGLITVEDGAFFDMQNEGSGSFGTLTTGGIRVL